MNDQSEPYEASVCPRPAEKWTLMGDRVNDRNRCRVVPEDSRWVSEIRFLVDLKLILLRLTLLSAFTHAAGPQPETRM